MAEDGAVDEDAQRPDRLVEHRRRADADILARKAAADIQQRGKRRAQHGALRKAKRIDDQRIDHGGDRRRNGRALHAQRGKAAQAEDQQRIEHDVGHHRAGRADKGDDNPLRALQQSRSGFGQRLEGIAERDDAQIPGRAGDGLRISGEHADHLFGDQQTAGHEQEAGCKRKDAHQAVCAVDTPVIARAEILRDEHGGAAGAAKEHDIEKPRPLARHAHGSQRKIAEPADHHGINERKGRKEQVLQRKRDGNGEHRPGEPCVLLRFHDDSGAVKNISVCCAPCQAHVILLFGKDLENRAVLRDERAVLHEKEHARRRGLEHLAHGAVLRIDDKRQLLAAAHMRARVLDPAQKTG